MSDGVVVIDEGQRVQVWDATSADTWGLRTEEVLGRPFADLDCGLPTDDLLPMVVTATHDGVVSSAELSAVNRVGRQVTCAVQVIPLHRRTDQQGAILILILTVRPEAQ